MQKIWFCAMLAAFLCASAACSATEIDFSKKLVDLDGKPYRDCTKTNVAKTECEEWIDHTLGLIAYSALDKAEQGLSVLEQARRASIARKVYPVKDGKHVVDLSAQEITIIVDQIGKLQLRPVELISAIEMLDPSRIKDK